MRLASYYLPLNAPLNLDVPAEQAPRGTVAYYLQCIGGNRGLAQLYLDAGLLHLEGAASTLLSTSFSSLSSIRLPLHSQVEESGTEAWKRDREAAAKYFERAQMLQPSLDIPTLPHETIDGSEELEMPSMELAHGSARSGQTDPDTPVVRRRRKKEEMTLFDNHVAEDVDNTWYVYIPGLVGAGTALLAVGIIGVLSFSTWSRRNQGT